MLLVDESLLPPDDLELSLSVGIARDKVALLCKFCEVLLCCCCCCCWSCCCSPSVPLEIEGCLNI